MQPYLRSQYHKLWAAMMIVAVLTLAILIEGGRAGSEHQTIPTAPPPTATDITEIATEVPAIPTQPTVVLPLPTSAQPSQTAGATSGIATASPSSEPSATREPGDGILPILTETPQAASATGSTASATVEATPTEEGEASGLTTSEAVCVIGLGGGLLILAIGLGWLRRRRKG